MVFHGVEIEERATTLVPIRQVSAAIPFVVGMAPIHLSGTKVRADLINKPVYIGSYAEYLAKFGDTDNIGKYTLSEFAKVFFTLYGVGPAIFVNVMNPAVHGNAVAAQPAVLVGGAYTIVRNAGVDVDIASVVVKSSPAGEGQTTYVAGDDYTLAYNALEQVVITRVATGDIPSATSALLLDWTEIPAAPCEAADIIGTAGVGGLECIHEVPNLYQVQPGMIVCPGFSQDATVYAAMEAKCTGIDSLFGCIAIPDLDSGQTAATYTAAITWKTTNNYTGADGYGGWPKFRYGAEIHWASCHIAGLIAEVDAENDNVPFVSPSSHKLRITGTCLADGTDINITNTQADALNAAGIATAVNREGWKLWGNRTLAYPGTVDPKDAFLSIRRMFKWIGNEFILTMQQMLDDPINRRTVESAENSFGAFLNGLIQKGALNDGRCKALPEENPDVNLADGKLKLHLYLTPPAPAEKITGVLEYDAAGNSAVWG